MFSVNLLNGVITFQQTWGLPAHALQLMPPGAQRPHEDQSASLQGRGQERCHHLSELALGYNGVLLSWVPRLHPLPYIIHSLQGYPGELVRSSGMDVTLDGMLTVLDEHYNNVKALDALNQAPFQLQIGEEEMVSEWGCTFQGTSKSL